MICEDVVEEYKDQVYVFTRDLIKEFLDENDDYMSLDKALDKYPFSKTELDKYELEDWLHPIKDSNENPLYPKNELDDLFEEFQMGVKSDYLMAIEVKHEFGIDKPMLDQMERLNVICPTRIDGGKWLYNKVHIQDRIDDILLAERDD